MLGMLNFGNELINQAGECMLMTSRQKADEIIKYLKRKIWDGYNPNEIDIDYSDVTDSDMDYIKREIESYYKLIHY